MQREPLDELVALSAQIGNNLDLVQAGGGNTSVKEDGVLWVKASGKWLSHAAKDDMFLPVPMADIARQLAAQDEKFPEYRTRSGAALRPSVETAVHAVLPQQVVIHVHSVRTIAWASQTAGCDSLSRLLSGLNWLWIPYIHPGIPLAIHIRGELQKKPDVLILQNHGLVVAADTFEAARQLLGEVEARLDTPTRAANSMNEARLQELTNDTGWRIAEDVEVHALAAAPTSVKIAAGGTLFPDQCVYLGPAAAIVDEADTLAAAAQRYQSKYDFTPVFLIVPNAGVVTQRDLKLSARQLLLGLKRVIERIPDHAPPSYLPVDQVARLMNWDAEKYRIAMAKQDT